MRRGGFGRTEGARRLLGQGVGRGRASPRAGRPRTCWKPSRMPRRRGAKVLSIVNAAGSTLARESDLVLLLNCGPEVGVAATKSFTAQVVVANMVVDAVLGKKRTERNSRSSLKRSPRP